MDLTQIPNEELSPAGEEQKKEQLEILSLTDTQMDDLGAHLSKTYSLWKDAKNDVEQEWLRNMRQYNGEYEPEVLAEIQKNGGKSQVFVNITRTKVMAAYSKIVDLLFQPGEQPYSINPTPVPDIPNFKEQLFLRAAMEIAQVAPGLQPGERLDFIDERLDELEKEYADEAEKRCKKMQKRINDQTLELDFERELKLTILEMCILGSGAMKAGSVRYKREKHWVQTPEGQRLVFTETPIPELGFVSCWDLYVDPFAISMDDSDGIFRRHVMTPHTFRSLKEVKGFKAEQIEKICDIYPTGNHSELPHETERRSMAKQNQSVNSGKYEVLEFWGIVSGKQLRMHGVEIGEEDEEYEANVWICGGNVIMARLNPLPGSLRPYNICPYEKNPHSVWGIAPPKMMRHSQATMNAAMRIAIDNGAISSGPLIEVNKDLMAPGTDPQKIYPWKVFVREGGDPAAPAVRFYQPEANQSAIMQIMETARRFADEETSLPSYTHGMQSNAMNSTATGMSMLMGAANINLKSVIKNMDDYLIRPVVEALYHWNMEYSDDPTIKGDMKVVARGSTALLQKEIQSQRLMQFMSITANPIDAPLTDRQYLLREAAKAMEINSERAVPEMPNAPQVPQAPEEVAPQGGDGLVTPQPPPPDVAPGMGANGALTAV